MSWLLKLCGTLEQYLLSLNIAPDIVQYILSQPGPQGQFLTNEVRKNPGLSLQDLQGMSYKKNEYKPTVQELRIANEFEHNDFSNWVLVQLRKLRLSPITELPGLQTSPSFKYKIDLYVPDQIRRRRGQNNLGVIDQINLIYDWYRFAIPDDNPDIASYSYEQAIAASNEWHEVQAGKGAGKIYGPTKPELIVYGPQWKNEKFNGYTIQRVMTENDLLTEGNKMNHCVGSYCDEVVENPNLENQVLKRIFSLRDPSNEPHVTISMDYSENSVEQIQGNSNKEPNTFYKAMIKEWVSTIGGVYSQNDDFDYEKIEDADIRRTDDALEKALYPLNEYGLSPNWSNFDIKDAYDAVMRNLNQRGREYQYYRWMGESAYTLVDAAEKSDEFFNINPDNKNSSIEKLWEIIDNNQEAFMSTWDYYETFPNEEDFSTIEEFQLAEKQYEENESQEIGYYQENNLPYAFDTVMARILSEREKKKKGIIPKNPENTSGDTIAVNWLITHLLKEARGRKFNPQDKVRYFTENRKGTGKGVVLTPSFNKGTVVDFDQNSRRYKVKNNENAIVDVHPRNLIPESITQRTIIESPTIQSPITIPISQNLNIPGI